MSHFLCFWGISRCTILCFGNFFAINYYSQLFRIVFAGSKSVYAKCVCVSIEQIYSNYRVYYLLSFIGNFLLSSLLTYSLLSLNVQMVRCGGYLFSLLEPGCHMLCDLSQMAYCNLFIAGFYVRCHEDVRLKCCFDSKIVFLCTCCFDSKIMKISQQYICAKLCLKRLQPTDDVTRT